MTETRFREAVASLKKIEQKIQSAQVEIRLREQRLSELRPKKEALEKECQDTFGCPVKDLPALITSREQEFVEAVELLVKAMIPEEEAEAQ